MVKGISVRDVWVTEFDMSQIEEFRRGEFNLVPSSADIEKKWSKCFHWGDLESRGCSSAAESKPEFESVGVDRGPIRR